VAAQLLQVVLALMPVAEEKVPAGHCAVASPLQNHPAGQTVVVVVEPGGQKKLLAQVTHVALLFARTCVEKEPSGQLVQDALDGAAREFWKVPAGHDRHTALVVALTLDENDPAGHAMGAPPGQ
jgi:hypothetical protein